MNPDLIRKAAVRLSLDEAPRVAHPINAPGGLYVVVRATGGHANGADVLAFAGEQARRAGYRPDGKTTMGFPSRRDPSTLTYAVWFHDRGRA
jgi:hypothetical protein